MKEAGPEGMAKIGADYLILGSITEFGRKAQGQEGVFTSTKTQTVEAGVSLRLVEAATGLIIYSDEAKGYAETTSKQTLGIGGTAGYDATYILTYDDGSYIISGGASQGLQPGDSFIVYAKGKSVKNPQTGMMVELPGKPLGKVTVLTSFGDTPETELSYCSYEGQDIDEDHLDKYYISDK